MSHALTIGDFSKATHLSIRTLRHYHQIGLLEPTDVDPDTGYRRYATEQIPAAQVIRRFRALDMSLDDIQAVLEVGPRRRAHGQRPETGVRMLVGHRDVRAPDACRR